MKGDRKCLQEMELDRWDKAPAQAEDWGFVNQVRSHYNLPRSERGGTRCVGLVGSFALGWALVAEFAGEQDAVVGGVGKEAAELITKQ